MIKVLDNFECVVVRGVNLEGLLGYIVDELVPGKGKGSCPNIVTIFGVESIVFGVFVFLHVNE